VRENDILRPVACLRGFRCLVVALVVIAPALFGQAPSGVSPVRPCDVVLIGSPAEDRARIAEIIGKVGTGGALIRSASRSWSACADSGARLAWVGPDVRVVDNASIPVSMNEGSLWAGGGLSEAVTAGAALRLGIVSGMLVPEFDHSQNAPFNTIASTTPGRSPYASPYHDGPSSIDLPTRFGNAPLTSVSGGQSALWITAGPVAAGVATENEWWGPGIENAIIMSNNAPGIPHAFLRTAHGVETPLGVFNANWFVGGLTDSRFFAEDSIESKRFLSGAVATFTPASDSTLTLGAARVVYGAINQWTSLASHAPAVFTHWSDIRDSAGTPNPADQLTSLFGRWVFPETGAEVYVEWARFLLPSSIRDMLIDPQQTQGYTLGFQVVRPVWGGLFRTQAEATDLEQTPPSRAGDTLSFYTSSAVPAGYTERGEVIGAAIGPGGSSQWIALDFIRPRWQFGVDFQRIRWDNDEYYLAPTGFSFFSQDVSIAVGLRASAIVMGQTIDLELGDGTRFNYLFQNLTGGFGAAHANDESLRTIRIRVTSAFPAWPSG
jgi:hypothetical protein